ncbi:3-phytase (myo-inositol-hexaphosphate 3-phosphohydrolase) [Rubidibacter lacunae KORDI 51-2]|uniref:3-phytase (Myo-inositol-hexaphosphate 3-phosphohydrolase) n=1 Tax=Rubidibacter lacunae KORDI 51-2 TaxID=582515 RepID=U5DNR8_9CHRO|nr:phytase [Rubidibacter lacunae]ERN42249.1 3-phytase (myo-inositol-hexaphosphate 3-phosphohydrolase) [Rubidibacter lacunae KORDI 51-2]
MRFASFNASLNRGNEGDLIAELSTPDSAQPQVIAEIVQRTNPDVVLINEFDFDADGTAAELFRENYLEVAQSADVSASEYPFIYVAPSNTGVPSGFDLDNSGDVGGPGDAFGFGFFPGQFGMVLYSKHPIIEDEIRTFQNFRWQDMPGALLPDDPNTSAPADWYSPEELEIFRLSSKSHWDIPIEIGNGDVIHVLASHPTPPVFDGPEDRNGTRNHDEIRFWSDYITPGAGQYIYDDEGGTGGLGAGKQFVIMGDLNADPFDGDSTANAARQLTENPLLNNTAIPSSTGGPEAADRQGLNNLNHAGNPAFDTADFAEENFGGPGNLRVDYTLPSRNLEIKAAGVFWPTDEEPQFSLVGDFPFPSSDHRLVYVDVDPLDVPTGQERVFATALEFLGEDQIATGTEFAGTVIGGLSGITYDAENDVYYAISDDRSQFNPARYYDLSIDLGDGSLDPGDSTVTEVTTLLGPDLQPFPESSLDPEGIALTEIGSLFISSEGDANALIDPFVNEFALDGRQLNELPVSDKFLPTADQSSGIRNNAAFESLTISPDQRFLYTATEDALFQDGPRASLDREGFSRIVQYDLETGEVLKEIIYELEPIAAPPIPEDAFAVNGLVELLAVDNAGTLLALERSFSAGVGNSIRLYEIQLQNTTDVRGIDGIADETGAPFDVDAIAEKRLLADFGGLEIVQDNIEGMTLGPVLPDGRQSLIIVSDNNFNDTQVTQVLAFAIETKTVPVVEPTLETPPLLRFENPADPQEELFDADDPAIYIHPTDPDASFVITALKNGGFAVYDLTGQELQLVAPDNIRYNNVDLVYNFELGSETVDLAVFSDRRNDSLEVYRIDPATGQLNDVTAAPLLNPAFSIFGVDDGEATAYGLVTYTSPVSGTDYAFTTQADGNLVAQLELVATSGGLVDARVVCTLELPVPTGDPEDSQSEGLVIDRETGTGYVALEEEVGILKFAAEPNGGDDFTLVQPISSSRDLTQVDSSFVQTDTSPVVPDIEGLTIYYGEDGEGYLIASSQGDNTYSVFAREEPNEFLGSFAIGENNGVDGVQESDGLDIINVPIGGFESGLLVVQDGSAERQVVFQDPEDGEIQNFAANFKYVSLDEIAETLNLDLDPDGFDPRNPQAQSLVNDIASGDTTQDSTVLWARSTFLGEVTFEVSTDPSFGTILETVTATVTDASLPVKVEIDDLNPGTQYVYRVTDAAGAAATGRFRTSDELGTFDGLRFGVTGDWRGEIAPYPAIANAPGRNLEFFVEHGDTIYADFGSPALLNPDGTRKQQAETLEDYRAKYVEVYGSRFGLNAWGDLRSSTSILATIDDHEVINDFAGGATADTDDRFPETAGLINDTQLYENGLQAFQEYKPLRDEFYGETGEELTANERQLYRFNTYGSDAATFVLDNRSFRDPVLAGPNLTDPADVGRFLTESLTLDRTMLDEVQLEDLLDDLLQAEQNGITWKFVMVPEPIQELGLFNADAFEGYAQERTEILSFIEDNNINNVVFVAADIHGTFINNLTYQEVPGGERIPTGAFEITTGSVGFNEPFGQSAIQVAAELGLISEEELAFYNSLPIAPDPDNIPDDRDDFLVQALTDLAIEPFGFDPIGLEENLPGAEGRIDATLLQGGYTAAHTFGWSEFDIDPVTQVLTVTTYGIESYSEAELLADPEAILARTPQVVSQFEVVPQNFDLPLVGPMPAFGTIGPDRLDSAIGDFNQSNAAVFGGSGNDLIDNTTGGNSRIYGGSGVNEILGGTGDRIVSGSGPDTIDTTAGGGGNRIYSLAGNDIIFLGSGDRAIAGADDDQIFTIGGGNTLTGSQGSDLFGVVNAQLPEEENTITDFEVGIDTIGIAGVGASFADLTIGGETDGTIALNGTPLATLLGVPGSSLSAGDFTFE